MLNKFTRIKINNNKIELNNEIIDTYEKNEKEED